MRKSVTRSRWVRTGIVLALNIGLFTPAVAGENILELKCRSLLQRMVFNCGCTTEFLDQHFNAEQADILLRLWVVAVNNDESSRDLTALYGRYGRAMIDNTVMRFHTHRDRLRVYCAQGDGPGITD